MEAVLVILWSILFIFAFISFIASMKLLIEHKKHFSSVIDKWQNATDWLYEVIQEATREKTKKDKYKYDTIITIILTLLPIDIDILFRNKREVMTRVTIKLSLGFVLFVCAFLFAFLSPFSSFVTKSLQLSAR